MSQQCTTWQKNHLNLANMAFIHDFCLKQSETLKSCMKGVTILFLTPCICTTIRNHSAPMYAHGYELSAPQYTIDENHFGNN